ncbi:DUF1127 domain-containing protein [Aliiroseovarius sp. F20344]|uniref:DUF1127 domain-containing protein n=1 Tax=Aliiroseovarius sp. F20344 TaxID=2926414 RepID=UPI001FF2611F|nr:DUF1127 domain-containing protein [Aliiroseovarius sp. F20344]MCK0142696.1 DUF1127 domain-containing protein [Aliiroseovarius sp. F20344]
MTAVTCTNAPIAKRSFSPLTWVANMLETRRERQALAELDAYRLEDIGLTEAEAHREATRPLWDVPAHWQY